MSFGQSEILVDAENKVFSVTAIRYSSLNTPPTPHPPPRRLGVAEHVHEIVRFDMGPGCY